MSLRDQYNNSSLTIHKVDSSVESVDLIKEVAKTNTRINPEVDYSELSNFVRYGSAEKYFEDAFTNVYDLYPYDGSAYEKEKWKNNSSLFDLYVFNNIYPKVKGFLNLNGTNQYVKILGGYAAPAKYDEKNIYDPTKNRENSLKLDASTGTTIEFWFKTSQTTDFTLFHLTGSGTELKIRFDNSTDKFAVTYLSGAAGLSDVTINQTITDFNNWHHYAFTFINGAGGIDYTLYVDGQTVNNGTGGSTIGTAFNNVSTTGYIGSNNTTANFNGSIDEFRFWKIARTEKEVGLFYNQSVNGGTNTDDANTELGVYFKFNEGTIDASAVNSTDSIVLDYSGRKQNGVIVNYALGCRQNDATHITYEDAEPILWTNNATLVSTINTYKQLGADYDSQSTSNIINTLPTWITEEADSRNQPLLRNLVQIISSYFDTTHVLVDNLLNLNKVKYFNDDENTFPQSIKLLRSAGMQSDDLFLDTSILEEILARNETVDYSEKIQHVKNAIYQNIFNNLAYIYKTKGTEKSFRNLLRSIGIDNELVKINLYSNNDTLEVKDRYETSDYKANIVNFFNNSAATIYADTAIKPAQVSSSLVPYTFVANFNYPNKEIFAENPEFTATVFLTSSLFGVHSTPTNSLTIDSPDLFNFKVYSIKPNETSNNASFYLTSSMCGGIEYTSAEFPDIYKDQNWTLSVRLFKSGVDSVGIVAGATEQDYTFQFSGYNSNYDTVVNSFNYTKTLSKTDVEATLTANKRVYYGAEYSNFTSSFLQRTDANLINAKIYAEYVNDDALKEISKNPELSAIQDFTQTAYKNSTIENLLSKAESLIVDLGFNTLTGSDINGKFTTTETGYDYFSNNFGSISDVKTQYVFKGYGFDTDYDTFKRKDGSRAVRRLPESISSDDLVKVTTDDDAYFGKEKLPVTYRMSIDKSMYQAISDEMLNMFASVSYYNNLIGEIYNKYSLEYKELNYARKLFFERVQNTPELEKYLEFYRWIDNSIGVLLQNLIPASVDYRRSISNLVENHILERSKYDHKLPTLEFKKEPTDAIIKGTHFYDTEKGLAISSDNSTWQKSRKERDTEGQETIRRVINSKNIDKLPYLSDGTSRLFAIREQSSHVRLQVEYKPEYSASIANLAATKNELFDGQFTLRPDFDISTNQVVINNSNKIGNYRLNYEIVNTTGRSTNNKYIVDVDGAVEKSNRTYYNSNVTASTALPTRTTYKSILVNRFSAPGDRRENSEGMLDSESGEYTSHNSVNFRNLFDRKIYNVSSSAIFSAEESNPSIHKVPANSKTVLKYNGSTVYSASVHDNAFISTAIPADDYGFHWYNSAFSGSQQTSSFDYCATNLSVAKEFDTTTNQFAPTGNLSPEQFNKYILGLNGPYQNPLFKQIRNGETPVSIYQRENNYIGIDENAYFVRGRAIFPAKTVFYKEPALDFNERAEIKTRNLTTKQTSIIYLSHLNDKNYFSNDSVKAVYNKTKTSAYETFINSYVAQTSVDSSRLGFSIVGTTTKDTYYPNSTIANTNLAYGHTYSNEVAGTGSNGYDRNFATISTVWRTNEIDRRRTRGSDSSTNTGSISSLGYPNFELPVSSSQVTYTGLYPSQKTYTIKYTGSLDYYDSVWPMDNNFDISATYNENGGSPIINIEYLISGSRGELAQFTEYEKFLTVAAASGSYEFGDRLNIAGEYRSYDTFTYASDARRFKPRPTFINISYHKLITDYKVPEYSGLGWIKPKQILKYKYVTNTLSNNTPWYDSYDKFFEDLKPYTKNMASFAEYRVSDVIEDYIANASFATPSRDILYAHGYNQSSSVDFSSSLTSLNPLMINEGIKLNKKKIKFDLDLKKKFKPHNGFYPQQRTAQISKLFADSYLQYSLSDITGAHLVSSEDFSYKTPLDQQVQTVLQPFFAPGILFNTIKSGIAMDWPTIVYTPDYYDIYSGSAYFKDFYKTGSYDLRDSEKMYFNIDPKIVSFSNSTIETYRVPFESILDFNAAFKESFKDNKNTRLLYLDPTSYTSEYFKNNDPSLFSSEISFPNVPLKNIVKPFGTNPKYSLAMHNFLASTVDFFIRESQLTGFRSVVNDKFDFFSKSKTYYMDIVLEKDIDFSMFADKDRIEAWTSLYTVGNTRYSAMQSYYQFFGPPYLHVNKSIIPANSASLTSSLIEPEPVAYAPYLPTYEFGKSILRLSFKPLRDGPHTVQEIFSNINTEIINAGLDEAFKTVASYYSGTISTGEVVLKADWAANNPAYANRNTLLSCINFKQIKEVPRTVFSPNGEAQSLSINNSLNSSLVWSIQTKFETPVLNFNNDLNKNSLNIEEKFSVKQTVGPYDFTSSLEVKEITGIWAGYGQIPENGKGINLSLAESFDYTLNPNSGSLLKACGFNNDSTKKEIGKIANNKLISEAIIVLPFTTDKAFAASSDEFYELTLNNKKYYTFKLDKDIINNSLGVKLTDASTTFDNIKRAAQASNSKNSIVKTIAKLVDYVLPPELDWINNRKIDPFSIYCFETTSVLDNNDLKDIWQGLMPKIAKKFEEDKFSFEHEVSPAEILGNTRLPDTIQLIAFKVKRRAKNNYYELTDDSNDDTRFRFKFSNGQEIVPTYSYNWPYDYFSLIELGNIKVSVINEE